MRAVVSVLVAVAMTYGCTKKPSSKTAPQPQPQAQGQLPTEPGQPGVPSTVEPAPVSTSAAQSPTCVPDADGIKVVTAGTTNLLKQSDYLTAATKVANDVRPDWLLKYLNFAELPAAAGPLPAEPTVQNQIPGVNPAEAEVTQNSAVDLGQLFVQIGMAALIGQAEQVLVNQCPALVKDMGMMVNLTGGAINLFVNKSNELFTNRPIWLQNVLAVSDDLMPSRLSLNTQRLPLGMKALKKFDLARASAPTDLFLSTELETQGDKPTNVKAGICGNSTSGFSKAVASFENYTILGVKQRRDFAIKSSPNAEQKEFVAVVSEYANVVDKPNEARQVGVGLRLLNSQNLEARFFGQFPGSKLLPTILVKKATDGKFSCEFKKLP